MNIGFKTGPNNWETGKRIVSQDGAQLCEIWFNVLEANSYKDMFAWLNKQKVRVGLHHWGVIDGNTKTNLASANEHVRSQTIKQIKDTIDIGAKISCVYVNAHPGAQCLERISFTEFTQELLDHTKTNKELAQTLLLEAAQELHGYAAKKGVTLTIETLPARESINQVSREALYDPGNTDLETMKKLASNGVFIANDITHTFSQLVLEEAPNDAMWDNLMEFTKAVYNQTRLLHINTIRPPLNGTDSHNGILNKDFDLGVFPTREQLREFLTLFKDRDDVFIIPEPEHGMQENYQALVKLADSL